MRFSESLRIWLIIKHFPILHLLRESQHLASRGVRSFTGVTSEGLCALARHPAAVMEGPVVGDLDVLADGGLASLHELHVVQTRVHSQGLQLGARKPLPRDKES